MVSAMAAMTASVSPSRQETTIVNTTPTMIAMTARRCHARILGLAERWARLPRRWPMPGGRGLSSAGSAGATTSFHVGLGGSAAGLMGTTTSSLAPSGSSRSAGSSGGAQSKNEGPSSGSSASAEASGAAARLGPVAAPPPGHAAGVPEDGVPEDGVAEDGVAEDGVAEDGVAEDGIPAAGEPAPPALFGAAPRDGAPSGAA